MASEDMEYEINIKKMLDQVLEDSKDLAADLLSTINTLQTTFIYPLILSIFIAIGLYIYYQPLAWTTTLSIILIVALPLIYGGYIYLVCRDLKNKYAQLVEVIEKRDNPR